MWFKIKAWFSHSRTIFAARLYALAGVLVTTHDIALPYFTGTDLSPITAHVPNWIWPLLVIGTGMLFEWLRRITTQSLADNKEDAILVEENKAEAKS